MVIRGDGMDPGDEREGFGEAWEDANRRGSAQPAKLVDDDPVIVGDGDANVPPSQPCDVPRGLSRGDDPKRRRRRRLRRVGIAPPGI